MNGHPGTQPSQSAQSANRPIGKPHAKHVATELLKQGVGPRDILKVVDISAATISLIARALGLPKHQRPKSLIDSMIESGATNAEIQKATGRSAACISTHRTKLGKNLPRGRGRGADPVIKARVRNLKIMGFTYRQIGEKLGFSSQRAQQYLRVGKYDEKPSHCQRCKKKIKSLHGHHESYESDSVIWLCDSCHMKTEYETRKNS